MTSGGTLVHKRKSLKDKERAKRGRGDSSKFNLLEHISLDRYLIEAFHLFIGVVSANRRAKSPPGVQKRSLHRQNKRTQLMLNKGLSLLPSSPLD